MVNFLQLIKNGQNPQQMVLSLLENQMQNTPMGVNLLSLARQNRTADIEKIARNVVSQQGRDFDSEFRAFRNNLGL